VESKNGSVVRKHLGYAHIPPSGVPAVNAFLRTHLWPYLNYHRPCPFPVTETDAKGRQRTRYRYADWMTPLDKLRSLPNASQYLKEDWSWETLEVLAGHMSDNEAGRRKTLAQEKLFQVLGKNPQVA
jgi:hypothetical protein